jgi:TolA-binding protein
MKSPQTPPDSIAAIASLAREAATDPVSPEIHKEGRDRLVAASRVTRPRTSLRKGPLVAFAFAAALAAAGFAMTWRPSLRYEVSGAALEGPYVSAPSSSSAEVRFSDGSKLEAAPGSRLRVDETHRNGARVLVEKGSTLASVTHYPSSSWTFVAGPFEVRVTGTRFDLSWDPQKEEIDLTLHEGSVEVRSPLGQGPISVRKGQRFRATVGDRSMTLLDSAPAPSPTDAPAVEAAAPVANLDGPQVPPVAPSGSKSIAKHETWQELVGRGEFESVVAAASARGIDGCISGCSAADLRSLADAARYTSRNDLAERSLLSLRQRFPGSSASAAAAFLLGRIYESRGQASAAQRWYETYGAEAPDGEFAAEALAGKMRSVATTRGSAAAKPIALEYLSRYPKGVHVKTARKIAGLE